MHLSRRRALSLLSAGTLAACAARVEDGEPVAHAATPAETAGPFYPADTNIERDADLTRLAGRSERAAGLVIEVRGRVLDLDGRPVSGAHVELWQATAGGRYDHPSDAANPASLDPNFQGYAVVEAGADGGFSFTTIRPGGYLVDRQGPRTPHFHWKIHASGRDLTTQSYFPDEPANETDFVIRAMGADVRHLIARAGAPGVEGVPGFDWDVIVPA
jgi:protocatechuate 3,4-dioxygenase beta subunit